MKRNLKSMAPFFCNALILLTSLAAHGQQHGFYFKADLGVALTQDTDLRIGNLEHVAALEPKSNLIPVRVLDLQQDISLLIGLPLRRNSER